MLAWQTPWSNKCPSKPLRALVERYRPGTLFRQLKMASKINISNRQRMLELDLQYVESMAIKLAHGVFANLSANPPAHLDDHLIEELAARGGFSLVLVSNRQIQKLNKEWMGKNRPTDVLSFPLDLEPPPSEQIPWEVGEIVISVEKADEQAESYGHSFERELAFLFIHGMLHILGFDHLEPDDEKDMFGRQKRILTKCGFKR
jgi:probable rRNA maturation factor